jgi:hypothetical protein
MRCNRFGAPIDCGARDLQSVSHSNRSFICLRCECALRSFEIAELLLLFGSENVETLGLHADVRDDQPCQQTCFCIGETFDLLCI